MKVCVSFSRSSRVAALQDGLRRLQLLQPGEPVTPGLFDAATSLAVRRFQWFAAHVPGALDADGAYVARPRVELPRDGVVGPQTQQLLDHFSACGWAATGLLVQLDFARLRRLQPNAGFVGLLGGNRRLGLCERDFAPVLLAIDRAAVELGLHVFVNLLFRVEADGAVPGPGVPPPSSHSPHRIGRAVDLQLGPHGRLLPGVNPEPALALMRAAPDSAVGRFRRHLQAALRCRYGGDFDPADPPHFDHQVLPAGGERWTMHHFFDQLHLRQALRSRAALPEMDYGET